MALIFRTRRPIARLAAGATAAGVEPDLGRRAERDTSDMVGLNDLERRGSWFDTTNVALLIRSLEIIVAGDLDALDEVFADDVVGWSPSISITSRGELAEVLADREDAFTDARVVVGAYDLGPTRVVAEWVISAVHTGPLLLGDELLIEGTDERIALAGATFAELRHGRISSFRLYFDDAALIEQLLNSL